MKKGLTINTIAGILDIIAAIIYFFAIFIIFAGAIGTKDGNGATSAATFLLVFGIVCLVTHIYGLLKTKKEGMKIGGHVLSIIGHGLYVVLGALAGLPAMILCILATIFTLKDNKRV